MDDKTQELILLPNLDELDENLFIDNSTLSSFEKTSG